MFPLVGTLIFSTVQYSFIQQRENSFAMGYCSMQRQSKKNLDGEGKLCYTEFNVKE
jgi:hypothetical protein